jgi:signal transduction histidine kinase
MLDFILKLFSADFMPHGMCYLWDPTVLWLNVLSDILIAVSYYAIPFLLFRFARRRGDIPFTGIFVAFGVFILACGTTHLMAALTVWTPVYRLDGLIKLITAMASVITFFMLRPLIPALIALPSPSELARVNSNLAREIEERRVAEDQVRRINEDLESRVAQRTAERHALEHQLVQSQKMEAVGRLAGGIAHDFNNLLTVILGYNDMLRDHLGNDAGGLEYTEEIQQAAQRASSLTGQLLTFSRRQVAVPRVMDLNQVVRQIEKMLRRIIGEDVALELHLSAARPHVHADPTNMDQVIMNLAVNARDAMPHGGRLLIETAEVELTAEDAGSRVDVQPGKYVMLAVSDNGAGMDEATRVRIFEPFFTTKEQGKGTGLGLSIVYGIVKQNGGEILVYSKPAQGSVFKVYLPLVPAEVEPLPASGPPPQPVRATETVLLVEDEDQVRNLAHTMLARAGYRVLEARDPEEALRAAAEYEGHIHLLLTDVVMPRKSGTELAAQLLAARPEIRVLYMSGYTDNNVVNHSILGAGTPFLQKPFTSAGLHSKVREALSPAS